MPPTKQRRSFDDDFKAKAVARLLHAQAARDQGQPTETVAAIANDLGLTEASLYTWAAAARKGKPRKPGKKKATRPNGAPVASIAAVKTETTPEAPALQLTGLRAWVRAEVRSELQRILSGGGG